MGLKHVIGFGALNVDLIYRIPRERLSLVQQEVDFGIGGETFLPPEKLDAVMRLLAWVAVFKGRSGGGSAANTVFALTRLGFDAGYIGKVGWDDYGVFLLAGLRGVATSQIQRGGQTGFCLILVDETGERTILVLPRDNDTLRYEEIDLGYVRKTRFLHLTSFVGDSPLSAQKRVVEEVGSEVKISFDPGGLYAKRGLEQILPIVARSFVVFATKKEISLLTGEDWQEGARRLLSCGPEIVVCKLGKEGAAVFSRDDSFRVAAEEVCVVDTVGAGDVFAAGFLAGLLLGQTLRDTTLLASRAAALSIAGYGRKSYPDRNFLERFMRGRRGGS